MDEEIIKKVKELVKEKLNGWYDTVESIDLEDLRLNVFLASMMGMEDSRDLVGWYFAERVERSIVTSFGFLIEDIAKAVSGAESWKGEGGDIVLKKDGKKFFIEIKSGTASSNVKMMRETSRAQRGLKEEVGGDITTALGLTYGKKEEVFGTMVGYYKGDKMLVGKEFWEFLTGDGSAHEEVLRAITEAREEVKEERATQVGPSKAEKGSETLSELMDRKAEELVEKWNEKYGEELTYQKILKRLF